ncbi:MAG: SU10 major capsid protein, partial [Fusobacteriaceae bacterium]
MTVLRSFDLNGNKKSFANWISNLSPKDVPFTSMIGKEKIDQTQYSWQTDALAPATPEAILEGEQFDAQPRASTQVITNFTSIIRREASVSDTAAKVATYGRGSEMEYQLKKAASEVLRDIEFQNLSTQYGHPGNEEFYSNQGGFKSLVATVNHPDPDTKAVVHTEIAWRKNKPAFTLKDIFDITANLYLAGSKADKIMFHPAHVHIFSDMMGYNDEEPQVYRMFDNVDTKFNMQVCKVKDPLGRMYMLIPNRYMPVDHIYIFNETDWTQTILRAPERIKIGKKGSSETMIIETQIGLRHRHPYASGVLGLIKTDLIAALSVNKIVLTAYTGENDGLLSLILFKEDGATREPNYFINWESSDKDVVFASSAVTETNATGYASSQLTPGKPGKVALRVTGQNLVSTPVHVEVLPPILDLEVHGPVAGVGKVISTTMTVMRHSGNPASNGIQVYWHSDTPDVVFTDPTTNRPTDHTVISGGAGIAPVNVTCLHPGDFHIWGTVGGIPSNKKAIYAGTTQFGIEWTKTNDKLFIGIDKDVEYAVQVKDAAGNLVEAGLAVRWTPSDKRIFDTSDYKYISFTDATGTAKMLIDPHTSSSVMENLKVTVYGNHSSTPISVKGVHVRPKVTPQVVPLNSVDVSSISTTLTDTEGLPMEGVTVNWSSTSNLIELGSISGTTNASGVATTAVKGLTQTGSGTIQSKVGLMTVSAPFSVGTGGDLTVNIAPNPSNIGADVIFNGVVHDSNNQPVTGQQVTFTVTGGTTGGLVIPAQTTTASGAYSVKVVPTERGTYTIAVACVSVGALKTVTHLVRAARKVKVVSRVSRSIATPDINEAPVEMVVLVSEDLTVERNLMDVANLPISARDPSGKFTINPASGMTDAAGEWRTNLTPIGDVGDITDIEVQCDGVFGYQEMTLGAPVVKVEVDPNSVMKGEEFTATATVYSNDGVTKAGPNVDVEWTVDPTDMSQFNQPSYKTDQFGKVAVPATIGAAELYTFIANVGPYISDQKELRLAKPTMELSLSPDSQVETGQPVTGLVTLRRKDGTFIQGQKINITTDPAVVVPSVTTDALGKATFQVIWPHIASSSEDCGIQVTMDSDPAVTVYQEIE